ncbi:MULTISPECIES: ribonuclease P protein component [unclassified Mucilaginibacter]|uniref:ribonuclease P protein component n=1 Tax=unclassified Mucilaginibacter TaxID=2617802 RepID=UPI00138D04FB|nr:MULTISPECIES: ribonuclease P protein component [unclassified Mucilaginibacter]MBB5394954.1 ribonuclease P protein component [Mucilaginibacter sp. AK015]QHS56668.1 ribonuclease P protein component [Mucilaginibacter sp. 14171R-50]
MYTFKKEERLCNKKLIESLFHNGSSFLCYPFKASWMPADSGQLFPVQIVFSVAKKRYKRAVDRNLVKRRMREAYRLNKQVQLYDVLNGAGKKLVLSVSYIGKEISPYDFFEKKMLKLLKQLAGEAIK